MDVTRIRKLTGGLLAAVFIAGQLAPGVALAAGASKGKILREGDAIKVRLAAGFDGGSATGDTVAVTIPDAWQRDPKGEPEIPAGSRGLITLKVSEMKDEGTPYDVTRLVFQAGSRSVTVPVRLSPEGSGMMKKKGASFFKKLLVPPLLGFLLWHGSSGVNSGEILNLEVKKRVDW